MKKGFASDNYSGVHPEILRAIGQANQGHVAAYGHDDYTQSAVEVFRQHFGADIEVFFVYSGTGANVLSLKAATRTHQAVICSETAHIHVDETGAAEAVAGCKLLTVAAPDGKLTPAGMRKYTYRFGDEHYAQPKVVSITQPTEVGTLYTPEEVRAIAAFACEHKLILHMDGARIANAAAALDLPLRACTRDLGVDILSFGGTKNGLLCGEAVVFFRRDLAEDFPYIRKQSLQLASKMRFISAQFDALLRGGLWKQNAAHANTMARLLAEAVSVLPEVRITQKVESNVVFACLPREVIPALQAEFPFYVWNEETAEVRWMTTFDTTKADVRAFAGCLKNILSRQTS